MNIIKIFLISSIIVISSCGYKIVNNIKYKTQKLERLAFPEAIIKIFREN